MRISDWSSDVCSSDLAGEVLLVHGAVGGVGLAAVETGKALGATVIATAGGADKLAVARAHGADHLVDYRSEDIRERVKAITAGRGRSEEHTSELQSLMRISYAVFCLKKKKKTNKITK